MTGEAEAELKGHTNSVTSVTFSQDRSTVVSAADDGTVRIWNVVAGDSQLMSSCDMNHTLLDGSVVHRAGVRGFHIIYPGQLPTATTYPALIMSDDRQWIVGPFHDCWIPIHYRDFVSSAFLGNRMCLGYKSGRFVIFDMTSTVVE
jgi:WD40 repeat protein